MRCFECVKAREVWHLAGLSLPNSSCAVFVAEGASMSDVGQQNHMFVLLWFLWFYRNLFTWQNRDVPSSHIVYVAAVFL